MRNTVGSSSLLRSNLVMSLSNTGSLRGFYLRIRLIEWEKPNLLLTFSVPSSFRFNRQRLLRILIEILKTKKEEYQGLQNDSKKP